MKITLCGSMKVIPEILKEQRKLNSLGHTTFVPTQDIEGFDFYNASPEKRAQQKIEYDQIKAHYHKIVATDCILVVNKAPETGMYGYIGGNTFLEMGFAHILDKPIYITDPLPDHMYTPYLSELLAMKPKLIDPSSYRRVFGRGNKSLA